jgi:hypothetical protein
MDVSNTDIFASGYTFDLIEEILKADVNEFCKSEFTVPNNKVFEWSQTYVSGIKMSGITNMTPKIDLQILAHIGDRALSYCLSFFGRKKILPSKIGDLSKIFSNKNLAYVYDLWKMEDMIFHTQIFSDHAKGSIIEAIVGRANIELNFQMSMQLSKMILYSILDILRQNFRMSQNLPCDSQLMKLKVVIPKPVSMTTFVDISPKAFLTSSNGSTCNMEKHISEQKYGGASKYAMDYLNIISGLPIPPIIVEQFEKTKTFKTLKSFADQFLSSGNIIMQAHFLSTLCISLLLFKFKDIKELTVMEIIDAFQKIGIQGYTKREVTNILTKYRDFFQEDIFRNPSVWSFCEKNAEKFNINYIT